MEIPHTSPSCSLEISDSELKCDHVPRFRSPRHLGDGRFEVTCMTNEHTFTVDELPDDVLETITRRLCERNRDRKEEEREVLLTELRDRGVNIPDNPLDTSWFVVNMIEQDVRQLESRGLYPEAYQMSQVPESVRDEATDERGHTDADTPRVMKVSEWALQKIPREMVSEMTALSESEHQNTF